MPHTLKPAPTGDFPAGISKPATRAFTAAGLTKLHHFTRVTEDEILALHGVGPKAVRVLRDALSARGLKFRGAR